MDDVEDLSRSVKEVGSNWIVESRNMISCGDIVSDTSVSFEETVGREDKVAIKKDILKFFFLI